MGIFMHRDGLQTHSVTYAPNGSTINNGTVAGKRTDALQTKKAGTWDKSFRSKRQIGCKKFMADHEREQWGDRSWRKRDPSTSKSIVLILTVSHPPSPFYNDFFSQFSRHGSCVAFNLLATEWITLFVLSPSSVQLECVRAFVPNSYSSPADLIVSICLAATLHFNLPSVCQGRAEGRYWFAVAAVTLYDCQSAIKPIPFAYLDQGWIAWWYNLPSNRNVSTVKKSLDWPIGLHRYSHFPLFLQYFTIKMTPFFYIVSINSN